MLYFSVGDVNTITIGDGSTIGDRVMVHCSGTHPTLIGDRVVVGAGAICHGCTLEDESVVGMGAQIMDGAKVQKHAMVAAGAVLSSGKVVPTGQMWAGIPAAYVRDLTAVEIEDIPLLVAENIKWAVIHAEENSKSWQTIELNEYDWEQFEGRDPAYWQRLTTEVCI